METPIYMNKQIEDLPNEVWVDCLGYDGTYSVSNLGRVKSLFRLVRSSRGLGERPVKERILKQTKYRSNFSVGLNYNGKAKKITVSHLVYFSFNADSDLRNNEVIMHIDKNIINNSLINLKKTTKSACSKENFIKIVGHREKMNLKEAHVFNKDFYDAFGISTKRCLS